MALWNRRSGYLAYSLLIGLMAAGCSDERPGPKQQQLVQGEDESTEEEGFVVDDAQGSMLGLTGVPSITLKFPFNSMFVESWAGTPLFVEKTSPFTRGKFLTVLASKESPFINFARNFKNPPKRSDYVGLRIFGNGSTFAFKHKVTALSFEALHEKDQFPESLQVLVDGKAQALTRKTLTPTVTLVSVPILNGTSSVRFAGGSEELKNLFIDNLRLTYVGRSNSGQDNETVTGGGSSSSSSTGSTGGGDSSTGTGSTGSSTSSGEGDETVSTGNQSTSATASDGNQDSTAGGSASDGNNQPPRATIYGAPVGVSPVTLLEVTVGGDRVAEFSAKVGPSDNINCASPSGYNVRFPASDVLRQDITGWPDGKMTVCAVAIGKDGVWQSFDTAAQASWIKNTTPPTPSAPPGSKALVYRTETRLTIEQIADPATTSKVCADEAKAAQIKSLGSPTALVVRNPYTDLSHLVPNLPIENAEGRLVAENSDSFLNKMWNAPLKTLKFSGRDDGEVVTGERFDQESSPNNCDNWNVSVQGTMPLTVRFGRGFKDRLPCSFAMPFEPTRPEGGGLPIMCLVLMR